MEYHSSHGLSPTPYQNQLASERDALEFVTYNEKEPSFIYLHRQGLQWQLFYFLEVKGIQILYQPCCPPAPYQWHVSVRGLARVKGGSVGREGDKVRA